MNKGGLPLGSFVTFSERVAVSRAPVIYSGEANKVFMPPGFAITVTGNNSQATIVKDTIIAQNKPSTHLGPL